MRGASFLLSLGLHAVLFVGFAIGWLSGLFDRPQDPAVVPVIPVELLSEAEISERVSVQEMVRAEEPEPEPEPLAADEPEPEPLPPEPEPEAAPEPEPAPPIVELEPEARPAPEPEAQEPEAQEPEPEPEPAPDPEPEPDPDPEDAFDLASLDDALKDLTPDESREAPREVEEGVATGQRDQERVGLGDTLTVSEEALLQSAFERCWNRQFGVPDQEKLVVSVQIDLNPDGSLDGAPKVLNDGQIDRSGNRYWSVARTRAVNAVIDCAPYDMVPERLLSEAFTFNFKPPPA